jgi:hypothetical protein
MIIGLLSNETPGTLVWVLINKSQRKQKERETLLESLPPAYSTPLSLQENKIHGLPIPQLVSQCTRGRLSPATVLTVYAKKTLRSHQATNCLTDIMFDEALASPSAGGWSPGFDSSDTSSNTDSTSNESLRDQPLLGVPVSIKGVCSSPMSHRQSSPRSQTLSTSLAMIRR